MSLSGPMWVVYWPMLSNAVISHTLKTDSLLDTLQTVSIMVKLTEYLGTLIAIFVVRDSEIQSEIAPEERICNNIGVITEPVFDRSKLISVTNANRRNKELEQAARRRLCKFNTSV